MSKIEEAREQINKIDKEIAELFEARMTAVEAVAEHKREHGLSVFDAAREDEILKKNSAYIKKSEIESYYIQFQKNVMELSKKYQQNLLSGLKVAYSGIEGAFAYLAAKKLYPDATLISKGSFHDAYYSVQNGECDVCILPIENSYAGEVGTVTELIYEGDLYINQVIDLPIHQSLIGTCDANFSDIKKVISHPQALKQCDEYIYKNKFLSEEATNTAMAAQFVKETNDKTIGAIASEETAEIYGLKVLESRINADSNNTTRFASFSRVQNKTVTDKVRADEHFIIVFTVQNRAGALAQTLNIIGAHGFNMKTLRSHPKKSLDWEYFFYIEADGNINTQNGHDLLKELSAICADLKLVGTYFENSEENL